MNQDTILTLYHGNDHVLPTPIFGFGSSDNDYGRGFYTTLDKNKAVEWAAVNGTDSAYVNVYKIDTDGLKIVNLDEYGTLAWISEIIHNRGARGESAILVGTELSRRYKVDLKNADIVIGYRADDSYSDIVDAFLQNQLNVDEVYRLFQKGKLGTQYFIKSKVAFERLEYHGYEKVDVEKFENQSEVQARIEVSKFLRARRNQILLNGYQPYGITAREAIKNLYLYDREYNYYTLAPVKNTLPLTEISIDTEHENREDYDDD